MAGVIVPSAEFLSSQLTAKADSDLDNLGTEAEREVTTRINMWNKGLTFFDANSGVQPTTAGSNITILSNAISDAQSRGSGTILEFPAAGVAMDRMISLSGVPIHPEGPYTPIWQYKGFRGLCFSPVVGYTDPALFMYDGTDVDIIGGYWEKVAMLGFSAGFPSTVINGLVAKGGVYSIRTRELNTRDFTGSGQVYMASQSGTRGWVQPRGFRLQDTTSESNEQYGVYIDGLTDSEWDLHVHTNSRTNPMAYAGAYIAGVGDVGQDKNQIRGTFNNGPCVYFANSAMPGRPIGGNTILNIQDDRSQGATLDWNVSGVMPIKVNLASNRAGRGTPFTTATPVQANALPAIMSSTGNASQPLRILGQITGGRDDGGISGDAESPSYVIKTWANADVVVENGVTWGFNGVEDPAGTGVCVFGPTVSKWLGSRDNPTHELPPYSEDLTTQTFTQTSYAAVGTKDVAVSIFDLRVGDVIEVMAEVTCSSTANQVFTGLQITNGNLTSTQMIANPGLTSLHLRTVSGSASGATITAESPANASPWLSFVVTTAGTATVRMVHRMSAAGTGTVSNRRIWVRRRGISVR